ncbi:protein JINGUBANG [Citrus clementina]|uniref:protein JINGUBANG n=1 Tax=Citrus clementina TaxID=85681 RepID=UPI000CED469C|nr:protein JINGUBANG [Citrus x clementina]
MEFYGNRKSLFGFMDEERNSIQSPARLSTRSHQEMCEQDLVLSPPRPSSTSMVSLLPPPSPESPWTLSPLQTPSPSILYSCIASLHRHEGNIYSIAVAKGMVFTGSSSTRLQNTNLELHGFGQFSNQKEGLLYTGSFDKTVKAWRVLDKRCTCVDSFVAHESNVNAIVVNQDDGFVFTCSSDGSVKIWRRVYRENSHTLTMTLKFQQSSVNALALSSFFDNYFLYSGSSDGSINFWEKDKMSGGFNHGGFLQGHRFAVLCLVAIEKLIFSGSEDTTIRVWRRAEGGCYHECLAVLDGHRGPVRCLAASLEMEKVVMGFLVYSSSLDQTFKVWRVKVMPDQEKTMCLDYSDYHSNSKTTTTKMDYEMSPVLSPSWVEKKMKASNYFQ